MNKFTRTYPLSNKFDSLLMCDHQEPTQSNNSTTYLGLHRLLRGPKINMYNSFVYYFNVLYCQQLCTLLTLPNDHSLGMNNVRA